MSNSPEVVLQTHLTSSLPKFLHRLPPSLFNFALHKGDRVAITGASGVGKTFFLRALCKLESKIELDVFFKQKRIENGQEPLYRSQVTYVSQRPCRLNSSPEEYLKNLCQLEVHQSKHFKEVKEKAHSLLCDLKRENLFATDNVLTFSGGEMQLFSLACTLSLSPRVLCLDEPTSSLDEKTKEQIEVLLKKEHKGEWIWITHDLAQLERISNRAIRLEMENE